MEEQKSRLSELIEKKYENENNGLKLIRIISDVLVEQDHEDVRNRLGSQYWSSGQWLLQSPQYLHWTTEPSTVLWLRGPVGVGKSCLTSVVIQEALANAVDASVGFYYCSQQRGASVDVLGV